MLLLNLSLEALMFLFARFAHHCLSILYRALHGMLVHYKSRYFLFFESLKKFKICKKV